ncbi:SIR2 family protein [Yersinia intermedia]|uniref:Uncharacterized protein n=1 Tax=Yersinia intermedia TaxID=631 RepID=A0A208ZYP2_YERIN|nr:SIR2 family protein [Yersinia intermedia]OVZ85528.1 hypothetical protein CBW57_14290 [Yersinia intermedia]
MNNPLASKQALLSAISRSKKPISILVGSPISAPEYLNALGVSSVTEIVTMIESVVREENLTEEYREYVKSENTTERYQEGFEFIKNFISQDAVNNIIREAVLKAYDDKNSCWHIPKGIDNICKIVSSKRIHVQNIITTNFDPLIEEGLKKHEVIPIKTILHSDGGWNSNNDDIPNSVPVVHLHGFWENSDTLHTPKQLTTNRPRLKSSLSNMLRNTTLLVIAYGGWDDIFIEALKDIAFEENSNVDIIWAFFEHNDGIVNSKYKKLFGSVQSISQRGRFRLYYDIECNDFFESLFEYLCKKEDTPIAPIENISIKSDMLGNEIRGAILGSIKGLETSFPFSHMILKKYPAHKNIRLVEQAQLSDGLKLDKVISLVSDWGMDRNGFLSSIKENPNSFLYNKNIYNIDVNECKTIDDVDNRFKDTFGQGIQNFFSLVTNRNDVIILFENISSVNNSQWTENLFRLINLFLDFAPNISIILGGDSSLIELGYSVVFLKPLSEPDIKTYISEHPDGDSEYLTQGYFDSIVRLSSALPSRLNVVLTQLKIVSLDALIEDEDNQKIDLENIEDDDPIPPKLKGALSSYISKKGDTRHYSLLKTLSILQYGDTYSRLKYFNSKEPFSIDDFLELLNSGLISSSEKVMFLNNKGSSEKEPVHTIHPLIGIYIRQNLDKDEYFQIVKKSLDLIFSDSWISGDIKFNAHSLRYFQDMNKSGPGNAHILICSYLRYAIEKDMRREIKAVFNLSLAFFKFLENNDRYKDLVFSATEIKALIKDSSEPIPIERLHYSLSKGLRMLGYRSESIGEMQLALENESLFTKNEIGNAKLHIALAYDNQGDVSHAMKYAEEIKKTCKTNSTTYTHAELIIANNSPAEGRMLKLKKVKRKTEKLGFRTLKSLAIVEMTKLQEDSDENEKLFNNALSGLSKNELYTWYSVIISKNLSYLEQKQIHKISESDISELCKAYSYYYTQRIDIQLGKVHRILWAIFVNRKDNDSLVTLFKYSSFIWRLKNNTETESKYANLLNAVDLNITDVFLLDLIQYARVRIRFLKQKLIS